MKVASRAFTLIEMLVSLAITMMMMGAAVTLFQNISDSVSGSRSIIEMSDRLRATRNRLQADLIGATASMTPPLRPENDEGYFEYIEGPSYDYTVFNGGGPSFFGDTDDILMFTVRSRGEPFIGMWSGTLTMESQVAEVIYFCVQNGPVIDATATPPSGNLCTLYRRVLLVSPDKNLAGVGATLPQFWDTNDLSARLQKNSSTNYSVLPNTLGDLTKRENRFAHITGATTPTFPFIAYFPATATSQPAWWPAPGGTNLPNPTGNNAPFLQPLKINRLGDDVLLTNVLAFDVQAFDPGAPVYLVNNVSLEPRDAGYVAQLGSGTPVAFGAYADLGFAQSYTPSGSNPVPWFGKLPAPKSKLNFAPYTFDTWSLHYENDGVDQDGDGKVDTGTNGLDDDGNGVVDDANEFETQPPYSSPLRGLRVTIRVYDPASQQVRQVTVVQDFLPE